MLQIPVVPVMTRQLRSKSHEWDSRVQFNFAACQIFRVKQSNLVHRAVEFMVLILLTQGSNPFTEWSWTKRNKTGALFWLAARVIGSVVFSRRFAADPASNSFAGFSADGL